MAGGMFDIKQTKIGYEGVSGGVKEARCCFWLEGIGSKDFCTAQKPHFDVSSL